MAAKQALGMNLITSIKRNKQTRIITPDTSVFTGDFDPILSINEQRLNEAEGEYAERKEPAMEPPPKAINS